MRCVRGKWFMQGEAVYQASQTPAGGMAGGPALETPPLLPLPSPRGICASFVRPNWRAVGRSGAAAVGAATGAPPLPPLPPPPRRELLWPAFLACLCMRCCIRADMRIDAASRL